MEENKKRVGGFAAMPPVRRRDVASKGGKTAHVRGAAHEFTVEEAREAGRKGGRSVSQNKAYMAEIGRRGGISRANKYRRLRAVPLYQVLEEKVLREIQEQQDQQFMDANGVSTKEAVPEMTVGIDWGTESKTAEQSEDK